MDDMGSVCCICPDNVVIIAILFAGASSFYVDQVSGFSEGFPLEGENGLMVGTSSESASSAARDIAFFATLIAINLAVMNMLPIPALDGGRIFFLLVDVVALQLFKHKVPEKYQAAVNVVGFVLLMGVMALVTLQDVIKLIS